MARSADTVSDPRPRVSIIVPALNEAPGIAATLAPLQALRGPVAEVLLVDGGSSDDTVTLASPLVDAIVRTERGRAVQMNAGANHARGDLLLFLHADTRLEAAHIEALLARFQARGSKPFWGRFDIEFDVTVGTLRLTQWLINVRSRVTGIATGDQAMFADQALFRQCGGFPDIPLMEDVALSKRMRRQGWPQCLRERVTTSSRRWTKHGVVRTIALMWCLRAAYALGVSPSWLKRRYVDN